MRAGIPNAGAVSMQSRVTQVLMGRFVWRGREVWLESDAGDQWGPDWYSVVQGGWGSDEGVSKLPRPWRFADSGAPIIEGDMVMIEFVRGDVTSAVARPAPSRPTRQDWLDTSFEAGGAERLREEFTPLDLDTGAPLAGSYRLEIAVVDGRMTITQQTVRNGQVRTQVQQSEGLIELRGPLGNTEALVRGESFIGDLNTAWLQAQPVLVAAAGFFSLPFDQIVAFGVKLATAVSSGSLPYLTDTTKAE